MSITIRVLFGATALLVASQFPGSIARAQARPNPPTQLCITDSGNCTSIDPGNGDHVKWNPGPYLRFPQGDDYQTILNLRIPEVCSMAHVQGIQIYEDWASIEKSKDVYDFSQQRAIYDAIAACGKRMVLQVHAVRFLPSCGSVAPSYLWTAAYEGGVTITPNEDRCVAMLWKPAVMDRFIALMNAIAAEFEREPYFEGVAISETAVGTQGTVVQQQPGVDTQWTVGYSCSAFLTQLKRVIDSSVKSFPRTNKILYYNFIPACAQSEEVELMAYMADKGIMMGGPDLFPQNIPAVQPNPGTIRERTTGQRIYIGEIGGTDYRRIMSCGNAVQPPEMGGRAGNHTPAALFNEGNNELRCSHIFWTRKDWEISDPDYGIDSANWTNDNGTTTSLRAFLNSGKGDSTITACPAAYAGCVQ